MLKEIADICRLVAMTFAAMYGFYSYGHHDTNGLIFAILILVFIYVNREISKS